MNYVLIAITTLLLLLTSCLSETDTARIDKINRINKTVNTSIIYTADQDDYWQSPGETLTRGRGDCEDYAILKAAMLGGGNIHIVFIASQNQYHAILEYDGWYLDNRYQHLLSETDIQLLYGGSIGSGTIEYWSKIKHFRYL